MKNLFRQQYLICPERRSYLSKPQFSLEGLDLFLGTALPYARLLRKDGRAFGYFFGIAVDAHGALVEDDYTGAPYPDVTGWHIFEDWIATLTGRWGVYLSDGQSTRFYTDPCGMIGAVYDTQTRTVAASLAKCLNRPVIDHPDYDHAAVEERGGKYTLFDTRDAYVRRMNPSCYLDLHSFKETRFWPRPNSIALEEESLAKTYDWLGARTERVVSAISKRHCCWLPLTAGQDSRLILAMAGQARSNIKSTYTYISNYSNRIDAAVAASASEAIGIPHEIYDRREHRTKHRRARVDTENFHTALGFRMPAGAEMKNGLHLKVPNDAVILRGHQTDLLRAVFSDHIGAPERRNTRWQIRRLMVVPYSEYNDDIFERFRPRYEAWMAALPDHARINSTDLMFLEMYYSSTIGCTFPAYYRNFFMSPFNGRAEIGRVMAIDEAYRRESNTVNDLIHRFAPVLDDVPFDYEVRPKLDRINDPEAVKEMTRSRREALQDRMPRIFGNEP